jgi:hypothetical protein
VNPGYVFIGVFRHSAEYQPADDRPVLPAWPPFHGGLTGHLRPAAGLGFSVAAAPAAALENSPSVRFPIRCPACLGDRQVSSEEKDCTAISQHLLPWMKVAVRAAKQDVG